jgi:hypothetical protein
VQGMGSDRSPAVRHARAWPGGKRRRSRPADSGQHSRAAPWAGGPRRGAGDGIPFNSQSSRPHSVTVCNALCFKLVTVNQTCCYCNPHVGTRIRFSAVIS